MVGAQGRIRGLPESGVPRRCRSSQTGLLYPFTVSEESPPTLWVSVELLSCVGALVSNFVPRSYKLKEGKKDDQLPPFRLGRLYGESRYGSSAPPPGNLDWNVDRFPGIWLPWGRIRKVASKENLRDEQLRRN